MMPSVCRSVKLSFVFAALSVCGVVLAALLMTDHGRVQAGQQDEKAKVIPPAKGNGTADKKDAPDHPLKKFMRQKLHASNQVLEGLCTEDLTMVAAGSKILMEMSREERWRVSNDIMYRRYSEQFSQAAEELQKEAEDNDMDGTSMAWVNVTMKCLKCHEWVRNTMLAESDK